MVVRPDGKLSLCCNDALGEETLGDLSVQSLREAWNDNRRRLVQDLMLKGRDKLDTCRHCDNQYVAKPQRVRRRDFG
jgi:radical SAM protein with 4Fe4S-binding SPASM domain